MNDFESNVDLVVEGDQTVGDLIESFLGLSEVMVGRGPLRRWLGLVYFATLLDGTRLKQPNGQPYSWAYTPSDIVTTLKRFDAIVASDPPDLERAVRRQIVEASDTGNVAKCMVALWYCAALIDLTPPTAPMQPSGFIVLPCPPETYGEALIWQTVGATAMGIPGAYYGHWSYPSTVVIGPPQRADEESNP